MALTAEPEEVYKKIQAVANIEFYSLVVLVEDLYGKLRLHIHDGSYLDVWLSRKIPGRYAYHWERRHIDGKIFRHDNRPHVNLRHMKSYPRHFHDGQDYVVSVSKSGDDPVMDVRSFLLFIKNKIEK